MDHGHWEVVTEYGESQNRSISIYFEVSDTGGNVRILVDSKGSWSMIVSAGLIK